MIMSVLCLLSCERTDPDLHQYIGVLNHSEKNMLFGYDICASSSTNWEVIDSTRFCNILLEPGRIIKAGDYSSKGIFSQNTHRHAFWRHCYWEKALGNGSVLFIYAIEATGAKESGLEWYRDVQRLRAVYKITLEEIEKDEWLFEYPYKEGNEVSFEL